MQGGKKPVGKRQMPARCSTAEDSQPEFPEAVEPVHLLAQLLLEQEQWSRYLSFMLEERGSWGSFLGEIEHSELVTREQLGGGAHAFQHLLWSRCAHQTLNLGIKEQKIRTRGNQVRYYLLLCSFY